MSSLEREARPLDEMDLDLDTDWEDRTLKQGRGSSARNTSNAIIKHDKHARNYVPAVAFQVGDVILGSIVRHLLRVVRPPEVAVSESVRES